ncbi:hypothetical protein FBUS_03354 [Fasciolopsis buskii]|uniref:Uncharacterized protein n=1 Tax=Fasciolopsis buskii TaxID=27845 RepID=A0A8E0RTV5_9TREM|nr:hypothetical protein FBUS_03354 [Fasciolopsis buski]
MGSNTHSPGLLSPRRRLRGYRSLSTNWEDSTDISSPSVTHCRSRNSRNTLQCATSLLHDIVSPKCSPLVRRVHISRLRHLLSSRDSSVTNDDQNGLRQSKQKDSRSSSTSSMESLDSPNRPNGSKNLIGKSTLSNRTLPPRAPTLHNHGSTLTDRGTMESSKQIQHTFVRNLFQRAFRGNRRKDHVRHFISLHGFALLVHSYST